MSTGTEPVSNTKVSRPQAKLRTQMESFDHKAMQVQEDSRVPQQLEWPTDGDGETGETTERRLPPVRMTVPNRNLDRMNKKANAARWLREQAGGNAAVVMSPDDKDIDAADHQRKNENIAKFNNFVSTVRPRRPGGRKTNPKPKKGGGGKAVRAGATSRLDRRLNVLRANIRR
jgi:hypothetical protein